MLSMILRIAVSLAWWQVGNLEIGALPALRHTSRMSTESVLQCKHPGPSEDVADLPNLFARAVLHRQGLRCASVEGTG